MYEIRPRTHLGNRPAARRAGLVAGLTAAGLAAAFITAAGPSTAAPGHPGAQRLTSPAAVVSWNEVAAAALATDAGLPAPLMAVGMAYVQGAVYNAVEGVDGGPLYDWSVRADRPASGDAAVAAAAHRVLVTKFPVTAPRVDAAYAAALAGVPDGRAEDAGVAYGEAAAARMLTARAGDGWQGSNPFTLSGAGVWSPTPPANAPFLAPWLATMRPFLIKAHDQFRPGPPPALTSARYARDVNEVQALGSASSTTRTAEQTEIARFFGGNLTDQLHGGYRDHIRRHGLSAAHAARYLALAAMTQSDAIITAWDAKHVYGFWRPVSAIRSSLDDGNAATTADSTWTPLLVTPPFPEYPSAHTVVTGAVTTALAELEGTSDLDLYLSSKVTSTTRFYPTAERLNRESVGARIWGGIHFRTADEVGVVVGSRLGSRAGDCFPCR